MKKTSKTMHPIQKASCTLLAACTLFSACGQASTQGNTSPTPKNQLTTPDTFASITPAPTPTTLPSPTETPLPTPTSTPTPTPEITPAWIFPWQSEAETDITDVFSGEEFDAINSLTYDPHGHPELFIRYHGDMDSKEYIIDLIKTESRPRVQLNGILHLQFYNGSALDDDLELAQDLCIYIPYCDFRGVEDFIETFDINQDGHTDFSLNLGLDGKNISYLYFVYDDERDQYVYLGSFNCPTFLPKEQVLYEKCYGTDNDIATKYKINGTKAIAIESVSQSIYTPYFYTYQKRIEDELVTIFETNSYDEFINVINISEWPNMDWGKQ